jgi:hypothetical protein
VFEKKIKQTKLEHSILNLRKPEKEKEKEEKKKSEKGRRKTKESRGEELGRLEI